MSRPDIDWLERRIKSIRDGWIIVRTSHRELLVWAEECGHKDMVRRLRLEEAHCQGCIDALTDLLGDVGPEEGEVL